MSHTKIKTLIIGVCAFAIVGLIFGAAEETPTWDGALDGVMLGATIGLLVMLLEVAVFPSRYLRSMHRLPAPAHFVFRLVTWFAIIFLVIDGFGPPRSDPEWAASMAISLVLTFVAVSFIMIQRIIGQTALISLLTGRYYRPATGEFAFLMIDLKGSTTIAEEIGNQRFFSFLDRFVTDACEPIRAQGGEIYKFVGDEIIAYWRTDDKFDLTRCLQTWDAVVQLFETLGPSYKAEFGAKPKLRAAVHVGEVVIGQIGQYKQEIAMLGEPMNAASRILELCSARDIDILISDAAAAKLITPSPYKLETLESVLLRGCKTELELFAIPRPAGEFRLSDVLPAPPN